MVYGKCRLKGPTKNGFSNLWVGPGTCLLKDQCVLLSKKLINAHGEKAWNTTGYTTTVGSKEATSVSDVFLERVCITMVYVCTYILYTKKTPK